MSYVKGKWRMKKNQNELYELLTEKNSLNEIGVCFRMCNIGD